MNEKRPRPVDLLQKLARYNWSKLPPDFFVMRAVPEVPPPYEATRAVNEGMLTNTLASSMYPLL
jgi:hypothetical protein